MKPFSILAVAIAVAGCGAGADTTSVGEDWISLDVKDKATIPLSEVSGLTIRRRAGVEDVVALGDRSTKIAVGRLADDIDDIHFERIDLAPAFRAANVDVARDVQWEGVAADGEGRVVVLEENPGRLFVFSADLGTLEHTIDIAIVGDDDRAGRWESEPNSRGEGLALLPGGHVLLLKEKEPRRLLELGPRGDAPARTVRPMGSSRFAHPRGARSEYVPLRSWKLADASKDDFPDLSDLAVGPDGAFYVLTDEGRRIGRLGSLDGETVDVTAKWSLGNALAKPEGLAIVSGRAFIGCDTPADGPNFFATKKLF